MPDTKIEIKDIISLIRAHYENDEDEFRNISRKIASILEKNGESQLELYIKGLLGETPVWVPM